jgi:hypothetical protein
MQPLSLLRAGSALALCAATLSAQAFLPTGSSIGGGDDVLIGNVALPFPFTFPGGTIANSIDISTNGWIKPGGTGGSSELGESAATLLAGAPRICAYWDDLTASGQVFFDTSTPNVATITWLDTTEFGNGAPFSVQAQLASTGTITIVWDNRAVTPTIDGDCLIGVSEGGGATDPGQSDFSDVNTMGAIVAATDTVYEQFTLALGDEFDLSDGVDDRRVFSRRRPATVTGIDASAATPAEANPGREACQMPRSAPFDLTFIPTTPGDYIFVAGGSPNPLAATMARC